MNRKTARLIKGLARISGRSEKALKKEYYSLGDKGRFEMKKEMLTVVGQPEMMQKLLKASEILKNHPVTDPTGD